MGSTLHQTYKELEKCVECLERDVEDNLKQLLEVKDFNENLAALETSKDYHYKEILNHLSQIKEHIKVVADHHDRLLSLEKKIATGNKIDKNYIKKQVENFQSFEKINRREHKPVRKHETSSMKYLEYWERIMEEQESSSVLAVSKRENTKRQFKKIVSSTIDMLLETGSNSSASLESPKEENTREIEAINEEVIVKASKENVDCESVSEQDEEEQEEEEEEEEEEKEESVDSKPRIVDVIYKKGVNGHV
ncbi:uncharacterized protein [Tenebrio molitor]|uniref:uncharacterized protein isoform X2 n=1 Tax=Tenebrio molitor TaxID=7067 RepID=UPI003624934B